MGTKRVKSIERLSESSQKNLKKNKSASKIKDAGFGTQSNQKTAQSNWNLRKSGFFFIPQQQSTYKVAGFNLLFEKIEVFECYR